MNIHRYKNDWLVAICLVVFISSVYGTLFYANRSAIKVRQLQMELRTLRGAVAVFYEVNERVPESLKELAETVYYKDEKRAGYLNPDLKERILNGRFEDPFNKPYVYDVSNGRIGTVSESKLDAGLK